MRMPSGSIIAALDAWTTIAARARANMPSQASAAELVRELRAAPYLSDADPRLERAVELVRSLRREAEGVSWTGLRRELARVERATAALLAR